MHFKVGKYEEKKKMKLKKITRWKRITNDIFKKQMFVWRKSFIEPS
jgi:hypothetical protein